MGFPIQVTCHLYIESAPMSLLTLARPLNSLLIQPARRGVPKNGHGLCCCLPPHLRFKRRLLHSPSLVATGLSLHGIFARPPLPTEAYTTLAMPCRFMWPVVIPVVFQNVSAHHPRDITNHKHLQGLCNETVNTSGSLSSRHLVQAALCFEVRIQRGRSCCGCTTTSVSWGIMFRSIWSN